MEDPDRTDARVPVLVGCGEALDRSTNTLDAIEPLALIEAAAQRADADAGGGFLGKVDSLDVVNISSWRYSDAPRQVAARLSIAPDRFTYAEIGGESPVRIVHDAALRIARGESSVALICGGEAQYSVTRAKRENVVLPWTPYATEGPKPMSGRDMVHPLAAAHGLMQPTTVYPLYEMATAAAWEQTPTEALAESGEIWARYSDVAVENPFAWLAEPYSANAIVSSSESNRLIAWPYTKLMVANPMVNQGAAVLVTSLACARAAGVPDAKMVYLHGGAAANEPRDFMARDQFYRSHAQDAVLETARTFAPGGFDALELYSCFPCVPKMARRTLGLGRDVIPSVTGGLTFFGAPLSNYMLHAICAMMRRLRSHGGTGIAYGQGEFVTKHHVIILSDKIGPGLSQDYSVQGVADSRRSPVPPTLDPVEGPATLETATVLYQRDGTVAQGVAVLRLPNGGRTVAIIPPEDEATLGVLMAQDRSPVGRQGMIASIADGRHRWIAA